MIAQQMSLGASMEIAADDVAQENRIKHKYREGGHGGRTQLV